LIGVDTESVTGGCGCDFAYAIGMAFYNVGFDSRRVERVNVIMFLWGWFGVDGPMGFIDIIV
tara:strand:+ start:483 stop:668 length:186 start_codon:yes stop_codon:yes gene_type:complete